VRRLTTLVLVSLAACSGSTPPKDVADIPADAPRETPKACLHDGIVLCLAFEDSFLDEVSDDDGPNDLDATLGPGLLAFNRETERAANIHAGADVHLESRDAFDGLTGAMSFDAWVRWSPASEQQVVLENQNQFSLIIRPSLLGPGETFIVCGIVVTGNPQGQEFPGAVADQPTDGDWHHIACVSDGSIISAFVDGEKRVDGDRSALGPNFVDGMKDLQIGRPSDATDRPFVGQVDNVRVWNRALTLEEIDRFRSGNED